MSLDQALLPAIRLARDGVPGRPPLRAGGGQRPGGHDAVPGDPADVLPRRPPAAGRRHAGAERPRAHAGAHRPQRSGRLLPGRGGGADRRGDGGSRRHDPAGRPGRVPAVRARHGAGGRLPGVRGAGGPRSQRRHGGRRGAQRPGALRPGPPRLGLGGGAAPGDRGDPARGRRPVLLPGRPSGCAVRHPRGAGLRGDAGADDQPGVRRSHRRRRSVGMARGPAAPGPAGSRRPIGGRRHNAHLGGGRGSQRRGADADQHVLVRRDRPRRRGDDEQRDDLVLSGDRAR